MPPAPLDLTHLLTSLAILVVCAHIAGFLANRIGWPPVVGELLAGLFLGPTILGAWFPELSEWITKPGSGTGSVLKAISELGVLLLMFAAGAEMRTLVQRKDIRPVLAITVSGVAIPIAIGIGVLSFVNVDEYVGSAGSTVALKLVLVTALAVTSIPVISRIFADLGLLGTRLARMVLGIAVLEDVLLYVLLSYAVSLAAGSGADVGVIPDFLHVNPASWQGALWHLVASIGLLAFGIAISGLERHAARSRYNLLARRNRIAWLLALLFGCTVLASLLGLVPMLGALVAGIAASADRDDKHKAALASVQSFAVALFIPIYFVLTGASLDLRTGFDAKSCITLLVLGCAAKGFGVWVGAKLTGEDRASTRSLIVSLNARGGPGIVLATTAAAAGIVDERTYTSLLVLAVVTSLGAGAWLGRMVRAQREADRRTESSSTETMST